MKILQTLFFDLFRAEGTPKRAAVGFRFPVYFDAGIPKKMLNQKI